MQMLMQTSNPSIVALIVMAVILAAAFVGWMIYQKLRTEQLRKRFGPEYDRQLETNGSRKKAEAVLLQRQERVEHLSLRPLSPSDRGRFEGTWRAVQARFVDSPETAVADADRLVSEVMMKRGYPVTDFEQRAADISVGHPVVVENYREAHAIALKQSRGEANTEELRQALIHFRALFDELVSEEELAPSKAA
jgi:hypothetical protein